MNTSKKVFLLWLSSIPKAEKETNDTFSSFKKYINTVHGDFSLLNLITEGDTSDQLMEISKTFLKKVSPNEDFNICIVMQKDEPNPGRFIELLKKKIMYVDTEDIRSIFDINLYPFQYFKGNILVLQSKDL